MLFVRTLQSGNAYARPSGYMFQCGSRQFEGHACTLFSCRAVSDFCRIHRKTALKDSGPKNPANLPPRLHLRFMRTLPRATLCRGHSSRFRPHGHRVIFFRKGARGSAPPYSHDDRSSSHRIYGNAGFCGNNTAIRSGLGRRKRCGRLCPAGSPCRKGT